MTETPAVYDTLMRRVQLGIHVEHFITKDRVGIYLLERAHRNRVDALEALAVCPADKEHDIRNLQMKAQIPDLFLLWLDEAIADGMAEEEKIRVEEAYAS